MGNRIYVYAAVLLSVSNVGLIALHTQHVEIVFNTVQ